MATQTTAVHFKVHQELEVDGISVQPGNYVGRKLVREVPQYGGAVKMPPQYLMEVKFAPSKPNGAISAEVDVSGAVTLGHVTIG